MSINGENSNNIGGNEMGTENGNIENSGSTNRCEVFALKPAFLQLLQTVGATGVTFTFSQIVGYLRDYTYSRRLFDPLNPRTIHCKDDELGNVFGVEKFTISEVINLLKSVLFRVPHPDKNGSTSSVGNLDAAKRRVSGATDDSSKRLRLDSKDEQSKSVDPIFIYIPDPPKVESASETELSIQGYETSLVKNSTDSWDSDDDNDLEEEDIFSVEYDVGSLSSDNASVVSDTDSDIADIICATTIFRKNDTDMEFWADGSSDDSSDPELSEGDKWSCSSCGSLNRPPMRFCQSCWEERIGWVLSKRPNQHPPRNLRRRQRRDLLGSQNIIEKQPPEIVEDNPVECEVKVDSKLLATDATICNLDSTVSKNDDILLHPDLKKESSVVSNTSESETTSSQLSLGNAAAICPLCLHRQKSAIIIHGKTGHQMCCYPCARHLENKRLPCPICRRTIQKVVRNYIV